MRRMAATMALTFGLLFGTFAVGAGVATAATTSHSMADCYPGPGGHGTGPTKTCKPKTSPKKTTPTRTTPTKTTPTKTARDTPLRDSKPVLVDAQVPTSSQLAFTGIDAVGVGVVGLALLAGGFLLVGVTRKRRRIS